MKALALSLSAAVLLLACSRGGAAPPAHTPLSLPIGGPSVNAGTLEARRLEGAIALQTATTANLPWQNAGLWFVDANDGWLLQRRDYSPRVLHTTDGGVTWSVQYMEDDPVAAGIQFVDQTHGWISGVAGGPGCHFVPNPECHGALLSTSDGGSTWTSTVPDQLWLGSPQFIDSNFGWIAARSGCEGKCNENPIAVLHTDDGGRSWSKTVLAIEPMGGGGPHLLLPAGAQEARMLIAGRVEHTVDGGRSWQPSPGPCLPDDHSGGGAYAGFALDPSTAWILCVTPPSTVVALFRTQDGGQSWQRVTEFTATQGPTPVHGEVYPGRLSLHFFDTRHGWFVSGGERSTLELTDDAGTNWRATPLPNDQTVVDAQFLDADSGWAAGGLRLWRTTDGGAQWQELPLPK